MIVISQPQIFPWIGTIEQIRLRAHDALRKWALQRHTEKKRAVIWFQSLGFEGCNLQIRSVFLECTWRDVLLVEWLAE